MTRRIIAMLLSLCCVVSLISLTACGKKDSNSQSSSDQTQIYWPDEILLHPDPTIDPSDAPEDNQNMLAYTSTVKKSDFQLVDRNGNPVWLTQDSPRLYPYVTKKVKETASGYPSTDNYIDYLRNYEGDLCLSKSASWYVTDPQSQDMEERTGEVRPLVEKNITPWFTLKLRNGVTFGATKDEVKQAYPNSISTYGQGVSNELDPKADTSMWPALQYQMIYTYPDGYETPNGSILYWSGQTPRTVRVFFIFNPSGQLQYITVMPEI